MYLISLYYVDDNSPAGTTWADTPEELVHTIENAVENGQYCVVKSK